jgi:hypothetical protein
VPSAEVVEPAHQLEVLEAGQVLVHRGVLARQANLLAHPFGVTDDVEAHDAGRTLVRRQEGGQDPHRRRLAGAVRAEKPEDAARLDTEIHAAKRLHVAVALVQAGGLDGGRHPLYASRRPSARIEGMSPRSENYAEPVPLNRLGTKPSRSTPISAARPEVAAVPHPSTW